MAGCRSALLAASLASFALLAHSCSARSGAEYAPVFGKAIEGAQPAQAPGSLKHDFQRAASAPSLNEARSRWEQFLRAHVPKNNEYQDGFEKLHVDAARYELVRTYYLLGLTADGDKLLRELDPLDLRP
jgi:hypothetical protein